MADAKKNFPIFLAAIRMFHDRGVRISAGTDLGNPWMTPGVSYHRELQLLAQAGIQPLEVLKTATGRGAEALGIEKEAGDIGVGKRADLVVLADDPTKDIANTRRIERVILGGREYTPADLLNGRNR